MEWRHFDRGVMSACLVMLALASPRLARAGEDAPKEDDGEMLQSWVRWGNGLKTESLVFNALSTNPAANELLTQVPLNSESFEGVEELRMALHDPAARSFMGYLVSCALGAGQKVSWTPEFPGSLPQVWRGGGGICPEWHEGPPSVECQERVSACILARNNPAAARVRVSLQGGGKEDPPETLLPRPIAEPDIFHPSKMLPGGLLKPAQPITSFQACDACGSSADCGWRPTAVGVCRPGAQIGVILAASQGEVCGSVRVCSGAQGCVHQKAVKEGGVSCGGAQLGFVCPQEGTFSVMSLFASSGWRGAPAGGAWDTVRVSGTGAKVLGEADLFPNREGAFYGNLFGPDAIRPGLSVWFDPRSQETKLKMAGCESLYIRRDEGWCSRPEGDDAAPCTPSMPKVDGSIYENLYVCSAPDWKGDAEDLPGRVCALPDSGQNCASHLVGSCVSPTEGDCADNQNFEGCTGGKRIWESPITTFMSQ